MDRPIGGGGGIDGPAQREGMVSGRSELGGGRATIEGLRAHGIVPGRPDLGGGAATPSFTLPEGAGPGLPGPPEPLEIGGRPFVWGRRTYVMGILNVTPDSFSGDGLLARVGRDQVVDAAVAVARRMAAEGVDILDVGGESSRPGHQPVDEDEELARVVPVVAALREALPGLPISIDTVKPRVAEAAVAAGAALLNDVWGVAANDDLLAVAAGTGVPIVLMHNRREARYTNLIAEVIADLERAIEGALARGVPWERILVDPGFGFGKTPEQNLALLRQLHLFRVLGRPILLGTSRKSTLGKVLDLGPEERLEATLATTALAVAAGVDIVRVHDVRPNLRVARMADAVVRGWPGEGADGDHGRTVGPAVR
jgi:dihydropteroate synthase